MKLQNKLVLLSAIFATTGLIGCDDSDSCGLTEESCQSVNKTFDAQNCLCVGQDIQQTCQLTQEVCESGNTILDVNQCKCVAPNSPQSCSLTQEMCESLNKSLDANQCECVDVVCPTGYLLKDNQCVPCTDVAGYINCNGVCMNVQNDNDNCGACKNVCKDGAICSNGKCIGSTKCNGKSYNTATSIDHCGACNNRCPDGKTCIQGQCKLGYGKAYCGIEKVQIGDIDRCSGCDDRCANGLICKNNQCVEGAGETYCNDKTTNTLNDVSHCGSCNHRCENQICSEGECVDYHVQLDSQGDMYCNDIVINILSDDANCGGCDKTCPIGLKCISGTCQPYNFGSDSKLTCNGRSVKPYSDFQNCGKCGNDCGSIFCLAGVCTNETTSSTITYCNGSLSYPYYDSQNCGGCGIKCGTGEYCKAGVCTNETPTSSTITYCNGSQCNPYYDSQNCGGCGITCTSAQTCSEGTCKALSNLVVGDIFTFGHYEQDNDTTNGKEPIEWRVLDKNSSGQYLVISEKALDVKRYDPTLIEITWEKSTIRSWLNGYGSSYNTVGTSFTSDNFIDTAFTSTEKAKIVSSNVPAHANPQYSTSPGNDTTDKIFLLSITEAQNYFSSYGSLRADATKKAVKGLAYVYGSESGKYTSNGTCTDVHCYSYWWLRSPGGSSSDAATVDYGGSIKYYGSIVDSSYVAVRPALWVNL